MAFGALCCLVLGPAAVASAAETVAETDASTYGLEVLVGYDGQTSPGAWTPVQVEVAPPRPVAGVLAVDSRVWNGGAVRRELDVEVAAGARNVYRFVVPAGDVRVTLLEGGTSASVDRRHATGSDAQFLVGHLGDVPPSAPTLQSEPTGRPGAWVGVDPAWLSLPEALDSLDTLVADEAQLAALDDNAARSLDTALVAGLQLVVVADGQGPVTLTGPLEDEQVAVTGTGGTRAVEVVGPAWSLEQDGVAVAAAVERGKGRIVTTTVAPTAAASSLWSQLVAPGEGGGHADWDVRANPWQFGRLMSGPDGSVPTVPWFAAFLAAYILVVGPLNGLLLRRVGRQELAWVTVPALTAVFTLGAAAGSIGSSPVVGSAARVVWSFDGAAEETLAVAVRAPQAGARTTTLPGDGWAASPVFEGGPAGVSSAVIAPVVGGTEVRIDLASLEFGGVVASRPTVATPPLTVSAVAGPDTVVATLTNTGPTPLHDALLRVGSSHRHVGTLAPGEERAVEVPGGALTSVEPWQDPFQDLDDSGAPATLPLSLEPLLRSEVVDGDPGLVWAVAASPDGSADVEVDGAPAKDEGTLFAVGVRPTLPGDGSVGPYAVSRELVSGGGEHRPGPQAVEGAGDAVLRYRFPAGGRLDALAEDLERGQEFGNQVALAVWDVPDRQWVPLDEAFPEGRGDPARLLSPLGELHVQATGELFPFEYSARAVFGAPADGGGS